MFIIILVIEDLKLVEDISDSSDKPRKKRKRKLVELNQGVVSS